MQGEQGLSYAIRELELAVYGRIFGERWALVHPVYVEIFSALRVAACLGAPGNYFYAVVAFAQGICQFVNITGDAMFIVWRKSVGE